MTAYPGLYMIIDGEKVSGGGRRTFDVRNPATGEALGELPLAGRADLDRALDAAQRGFAIWRDAAPQKRAAVLQGAARLMAERADDLARIATMEEGKPFAEARIEVMMNVGLFNFYAGECQRLYGRDPGPPRRPALDRHLRAGRTGRGLLALELPARQSRAQARRADRRRLLGDPEVGRGDAG